MSKMEQNVSYIILPFRYSGKMSQISEKSPFEGRLFFGYIDALYKKTSYVKIDGVADEAEEIQVVFYETGIGFLLVKYIFTNGQDEVSKQEETVRAIVEQIKNDEYLILNRVKNKMPEAEFFPASIEKNALIYNVVIAKISNPQNCYFTSTSESVYGIDKMHQCYCGVNQFSLVTNQHYSNLCAGQKDVESEQIFRDKYEIPFLMLFLLLHHERSAYLTYREMIVTGLGKKTKKIKKVKSGIMDLLTCYSFKLVSEDIQIQHAYSEYRKVLGVSEYEESLSDLVFRLDDELDKAKDKRFNAVSMIIAVLGMFQLISVVLDIINFLK